MPWRPWRPTPRAELAILTVLRRAHAVCLDGLLPAKATAKDVAELEAMAARLAAEGRIAVMQVGRATIAYQVRTGRPDPAAVLLASSRR